mgnify:CR=1 FL=1
MFHVFRVLPPGFSRNVSKSLRLKSFKVPGPFHREKAVYNDSHLAPLGAPLFQVPRHKYIGTGGEAQNFPSLKAYMRGSSEFFQVPEPLNREQSTNMYDDLLFASFF